MYSLGVRINKVNVSTISKNCDDLYYLTLLNNCLNPETQFIKPVSFLLATICVVKTANNISSKIRFLDRWPQNPTNTTRKRWRQNNLPTLVRVPFSEIPQRRTWLPYEIATIFELASPPPWPILAFTAMRSIVLSMWGLVNTCCHPLESFNLSTKFTRPLEKQLKWNRTFCYNHFVYIKR